MSGYSVLAVGICYPWTLPLSIVIHISSRVLRYTSIPCYYLLH